MGAPSGILALVCLALRLPAADGITAFLSGFGTLNAASGGSGGFSLNIGGSRRRLEASVADGVEAARRELGYYGYKKKYRYKNPKTKVEGTCAIAYVGDSTQTSVQTGFAAGITIEGDDPGSLSFDFKKPVAETGGQAFAKFTYEIDTSKLRDTFQLSLNFEGAFDRSVREGGSQIFCIECDATEMQEGHPISDIETAFFIVNVTRTECPEVDERAKKYHGR